MSTYHNHEDLPALPTGFRYALELAPMATSRDLQTAARHRWFYFKHSYSFRLVERILDTWSLPQDAVLVDNFVGSGTTLLVARKRGMSAMGYDLSPLAVTVSQAKTASYSENELNELLDVILSGQRSGNHLANCAQRLRDAFSDRELSELTAIFDAIWQIPDPCRGFFLLAALSTAYDFSRAVSDGGWLRWVRKPDRGGAVKSAFVAHVHRMVSDLDKIDPGSDLGTVCASVGDARSLPLDANSVHAIITSPPYPNRHDYSRVFHIGLLLLGMKEAGVKSLRYQSLRSHVEAKAPDGYAERLLNYALPTTVSEVLQSLSSTNDSRIPRMISGYFEDLFLSLQEVARILRPGGKAAYVVGNVRHAGTSVPVDVALCEIAGRVGLALDAAWVMRLRGNSAQQMGKFGREAARETVVLLSKVPHG